MGSLVRTKQVCPKSLAAPAATIPPGAPASIEQPRAEHGKHADVDAIQQPSKQKREQTRNNAPETLEARPLSSLSRTTEHAESFPRSSVKTK